MRSATGALEFARRPPKRTGGLRRAQEPTQEQLEALVQFSAQRKFLLARPCLSGPICPSGIFPKGKKVLCDFP